MKVHSLTTAVAGLCFLAFTPSAPAQNTDPGKTNIEKPNMKTSTQTNSLSPNRANTSDLIKQPNVRGRRLSPDDVRKVAPALENYTQDILYGEVWNRAGLSRRDRSIVTVA